MMQITPVREEGAVSSRPHCMMDPAFCPGGPYPLGCGTFGDDPAIRERDVLATATRDGRDRRMQPQTLLDAHGQEWQLGQVVPKETLNPLTSIQGTKSFLFYFFVVLGLELRTFTLSHSASIFCVRYI
jgi:hypothetical protein